MLKQSFWVGLSLRSGLVVTSLGLAVSACGSGDSSGLNGDSGSGGSAANGGSSGMGNGGSGAGAQGGSGGSAEGGNAGTGASGGAGLGGSDDGGASFGGSAGTGNGGAAGDAGAGGEGNGGSAGQAGSSGSAGTGSGGSAGNGAGNISCGAEVCGLNQGQFCCQPQMAAPHCVTASNQCVCSGILCSTIELRCDGTEDCPGKICCYDKGVAAEPNIACAETCERGITTDRAEVCKLGVAGSCTKGGNCTTQPGLPPGYGTCR
ncbi:MAG: hypothetical protein R3B07_18790 [Polyangiaceae bacterium]